MLTRRHIRVKVMQVLYAFSGSESDDFSKDKKFLISSMESMYHLYILLISLLVEIQIKAEIYLVKNQNKHLATLEDKNPNKKFITNEVLQQLRGNTLLKEEFKNHRIDWDLDSGYVEIIFKDILKSDVFKKYMSTEESSFDEDKNLIIDLYKTIIAPNSKLYDYIESYKLTWLDDLPAVNTFIVKLIKKSKPTSVETYFTPDLYKDEDDKQFALDLFTKTLLKSTILSEEIAANTKNWDTDRIASLDHVMLRMAVNELKKFPSIPTKVTINEYLEIAKEYSTPKSSIFINGILDKLVKEYQATGKLNKMGRGLM